MKKLLSTFKINSIDLSLPKDEYEIYIPKKRKLSYSEIKEMVCDYNIILTYGAVDKAIIDKAAKLELIVNYGVGYDKIDVEYATEKGITVINTPSAVTESTAELAYGLMISLMRRISLWDRKLRQNECKRWGFTENTGHSLYGKTLGIIGMGRIGSALARRAYAGGMKICYSNKNRLQADIESSVKAEYKDFESLMKISDVISIHVPLTPETNRFVGEKAFHLMKDGVFIINTSRGKVIDESALIDFLKSGKIAGAALDVFENEPEINPELMDMDNVLITPHIGMDTYLALNESIREAEKGIVEFYNGMVPANIINKQPAG